MAQLNTIIILRNDSTANWLANSSVVLNKGEVGIEFLTDGKVKMKIGDGVKTWAQLSYFGGETARYYDVVPEDGEIHVEAITRVVNGAELNAGDVAVVKETFAPGKIQHTAYVYDGATSAWKAMDGNYSADNVYVAEDLTLAGNFTSVGNYAKGDTIEAGTSLQSVLSSMLQQELYPTANDKPNATITASGGSGEVGSSYVLPTATLTIDDVGSYEYGDKASGITFAIGSVKLAQGADPAVATNYKTNEAVMAKGSTITLKATDTATLYTDSTKSYTFSGTASYGAGKVPVTNLGNEYASAQIPAGDVTIADKTVNFSGYRYTFAGGTTAATVDSTAIRALPAKKKSSDAVVTAKGDNGIVFTAAKGDTKAIFAYPTSWTTKTPKFELFTMSWGATEGFEKSTVQVADSRGGENGLKEYTVYTLTPATPFAADETKYSVHFE